jgi:hypothetical protein
MRRKEIMKERFIKNKRPLQPAFISPKRKNNQRPGQPEK